MQFTVALILSVFCLSCSLDFVFASAILVTPIVIANSTDCDSPDGQVFLSTNGGVAPYDYTVDDVSRGDADTVMGLDAGTHNFTIVDQNGDSVYGYFFVWGSDLEASCQVVVTPTCATGQGAVRISATGGAPPYKFSTTGTSYGNTTDFSENAGLVKCYVKDSKGCVQQSNVTIPYGTTVISVTTEIQNVTTCDAADGKISLYPNGGTGPYQFKFLEEDWGTPVPFTTLSSLSAGQLDYYVRDSTGCTFMFAPIIPAPAGELRATADVQFIRCASDGDTGIITVNGSCGTPPYLYSDDGGQHFQAVNTFYGLNASVDYVVVVKDFVNALSPPVFKQVLSPPVLQLEIFDKQPQGCSGHGSFGVRASGGSSSNLNYTFNFDGTILKNVNTTHFNASAGEHTISVSDDVGCTNSTTVIIGGTIASVQATAIYTNLTCHDDVDTGSITIYASLGSTPYTYKIDNGNFQGTNVFFNLPEGVYIPAVKDAAGCEYATAPITITRPPALFLNASVVKNSTCVSGNETLGIVNMTAYGGYSIMGNYSYGYGANNPIDSASGTSWYALAGLQKFYVIDSNGCRADLSITVYGGCCAAGYKLINGTCTDINECETSNGGCDEIVQCKNIPGNRTCGDCPPGYTGSGYSFCNTTCGDGECNGPEDCINCFRDCKSPTCRICGDGYCDASTQEDCNTCFDDCGACNKKCPENCNGHGTCANGVCICTGTWTDPTCGTVAGNPFNITTPPNQPSINLTSSDEQFYISIKSIGEVDQTNQLIRSFSVSNMSFSYTSSTNGNNTLQNYTAIIEKGVTMNVIIQQFENPMTTFAFAGTTLTFPPHTLKLTIQVQKWRFRSLSNSLIIVMDSVGAYDSKNCYGTTEDASVSYVLVVSGDVTLYGQFMDKAELDDRVRSVKYSVGNDGITMTVPHFWDYADLDPNFNVLLGDPAKYTSLCEKPNSQKKGLGVSKKIIAIVIPVVFFCAALAVVIILLFPRIKTWRKVRKAEKVNSVDMDSVANIEKVDGMETHTTAGNFQLRF